jgi:DNA-directed RNA polymerase specialized sigma24 family protein
MRPRVLFEAIVVDMPLSADQPLPSHATVLPVMGDPPSPRTPLENALATDAKLRWAIFNVARKRARTKEEAEDYAQEAKVRAIVRSRETGEPKPPPPLDFKRFLYFVGSFVNGFGANATRAAKRHTQVPLETARPTRAVSALPDSVPDPHRVLEDHHRQRRLQRLEKELREELANEEEKVRAIALAMLDWCDKDGTHENKEFAIKIGCSDKEVANARRRIGVHSDRVRARVLAEEGGTA